MKKSLRVKISIFFVVVAFGLVASSSASGQATIEIANNDGPGVGFNDSTPVAPVGGNSGTTLGQQRLNAFEFAAGIWGAALNSGPTIVVQASWESSLSCTATTATLGSASTISVARTFPNAPFTGTWYPSALANALTGSDSSGPEIRARFNPRIGTAGCLQSRPWYLGLDGNHGTGIDLVSVLLHEFGHGLGFANFTDPETGAFFESSQGQPFPSVWDRFLRDNSSGKLWVDMTNSERVSSAINSGNLVWNGPQVTAAVPGVLSSGTDGQNRVRMFSPNPFDPGSSVSHFDTSAFPNLLMEPIITSSLNHTVGPPSDLTLTLLKEIGWTAATVTPTPTPSPPPNDNFAAAQVISGCSGSVNGTNVAATGEGGEPNHSPPTIVAGNRSIWYRWQAPATGHVKIDTALSGFDTLLAIYNGDAVNSLVPVVKNDDSDPGEDTSSMVNFFAKAGVTYRIAVDGFPNNGVVGDAGSVVLHWGLSGCTGPATPTVLSGNQVELKSWKVEGRTFVYAKLTFPDVGYRVVNWGTAIRSGNAFSSDATIERSNGVTILVTTSDAQIWDLGALAAGNYSFTFRNSGTDVETLPITVSSTPPAPNPIDDAQTFVRFQYKDFLRREPDGPGGDHWTAEITQCSNVANRRPGETEPQCIERKRENTSAAFFVSPESQNIAYFVLRVYRGSLGRMPFFGGGNGPADEFTRDAATVGTGIIVNNALDHNRINTNKQAFVSEFVTRAEFRAIYDELNNTQYVNQLFQTTGVTPSTTNRSALIDGLTGGTETRASVLFKVVDGTTTGAGGLLTFNTVYGKAFYDNLFNAGFVQMEYFGYLQRDPDPGGYAFWLGKLNTFGDWVNAEMVKSFIGAPEYRARFGAP